VRKEVITCDLCGEVPGKFSDKFRTASQDKYVLMSSIMTLDFMDQSWPSGNNTKEIDVCLDCIKEMIWEKRDIIDER